MTVHKYNAYAKFCQVICNFMHLLRTPGFFTLLRVEVINANLIYGLDSINLILILGDNGRSCRLFLRNPDCLLNPHLSFIL